MQTVTLWVVFFFIREVGPDGFGGTYVVTWVSHVEHILAIKLIIIRIFKLLPPSSCLGTKGVHVLVFSRQNLPPGSICLSHYSFT